MTFPGRRTFCALSSLAFAVSTFVAAPMVSAADVSEHDLPTASPAEVGVDATPLIYLSKWLRKEELDVRSLLVVKDGKLIFERYTDGLDRDYNYELYSDTKGTSAILAGILIDNGKLKLDDNIGPMVERLRPDLAGQFDDKDDIQVAHLLKMSTGLGYGFSKENKGDPIYYDSVDRLQLAADTPLKMPPGQEFEYSDINAVLMAAVLQEAAGMAAPEYAEQKLFEPLAMKNYAWGRADEAGLVSTGWGMRLRAIDMAKVGLLMLNGGQWNDKQIVSQDWITQMVTPSGVNPQFGYDWWINTIVTTEPEYATAGFKGQYILVLPERNAVVVMTGLLPIDGNEQIFQQIVNDYVLPALGGKKSDDALAAELSDELKISASSRPVPGANADPERSDSPRK